MRLLGPTQVFVIQQAQGRAREFSLLTNSQVVLKLPVPARTQTHHPESIKETVRSG